MDFHLIIAELWLFNVRAMTVPVEARRERRFGLVALRSVPL
jgi:hypothetical protein